MRNEITNTKIIMTNKLEGRIQIVGDLGDFKNNFVMFYDNNGESVLAITRSDAYAVKLKERFEGYLKIGRLLPVYKSAYGYND